nr:transmembrane protein 120 homolog [Tanacetum cinerariifolium]
LTWEIERQPDCAQKQKGIQLFLRWAIMQGVAMLLQNRYQRQRLYTRIALGKARRMDVVWGETAAGKELRKRLAASFICSEWRKFSFEKFSDNYYNSIAYTDDPAFEAYVGVLLLQTAVAGVISEWQVITCGILLIIMAVGNFANTVQTLVLKSQFKAKMKKGKDKDQSVPESFSKRSVNIENLVSDRTAYLFLIFPSLLLGLRSWLWDGCFPALPVQLYQVDIPSLLCHGYGTYQPHLGNRKAT